MALNTPESSAVVIARMIADVESAMAPVGGQPAVKASFLNALIVSLGERQYDTYGANELAAREALPDTAIEFAERWAAIYRVVRKEGTVSSGAIVCAGTDGKIISKELVVTTGAGDEYVVTAQTTLATSVKAASITRVGDTAIATVANHGLASNVRVSVTGAGEPEYNLSQTAIVVLDANTFTYSLLGTFPAFPASGAPVATYISAEVPVESVEFSAEADLELDAALQFTSPIPGVNDVANVGALGISGGSDLELLSALKLRTIDRIQNPVAHFNVSDIRFEALAVPGVTRVYVQEVTPSIGFVTVYFMRDNDVNAIPNPAQVAEVREVLDAIRPADMTVADLIVAAPEAVPNDFVFTELTPNTASMKTAVTDSLVQFFDERVDVGSNIDSDAYRSAIYNTIDTTNGDLVRSFTLSVPIGDLTILSNQIGTLGSVTFSI